MNDKPIGVRVYVVLLERNADLACDAERVVAVYARCGFEVVRHQGPISVHGVATGAREARAAAVLLGTSDPAATRVYKLALRDFIDYVMAVGVPANNDEREGDMGAAYVIEPTVDDARLVWEAESIFRQARGERESSM